MTQEPKKFFWNINRSIHKRLLVLVVIGLGVGALVAFYSQNAVKPKLEPIPQEESESYTKAEIEALIKDKLANELYEKEKTEALEPKAPENRKFKTPIAVFIKKEDDTGESNVVISRDEALGIATGSKIKAHLANAIFSFNVTSPVIAIADQDVLKNDTVLIPKGTQFIGEASVLKSRDRINVRFSNMVMPDGREMKVNAMALSLDGSGGIKGKLDKQTDKSIWKSIGETFIAGGAVLFGSRDRAVTLEDELRLNAARNFSDDARQALNQVKVEESVTVKGYTPILILFLDPL